MKRDRGHFSPNHPPHKPIRRSDFTTPQIDTNDDAAATELTFTYREFIQELTATSDTFNTIARININPALQQSFPLLSNIARLFETYRFTNLEFEFKSMVSPGNQTAAGAFMMSYIANPSTPEYNSKRTMENAHAGNSAKVTNNVKVSTNGTMGKRTLYTRTGDVALPLINTTDVGFLQIATQGCPAGLELGELWATYTIILGKLHIPGDEQPGTAAPDPEPEPSPPWPIAATQQPIMIVQTTFTAPISAYAPEAVRRQSMFNTRGGQSILDTVIDATSTNGQINSESRLECNKTWTNHIIEDVIDNPAFPTFSTDTRVTVTIPVKPGTSYIARLSVSGFGLYQNYNPSNAFNPTIGEPAIEAIVPDNSTASIGFSGSITAWSGVPHTEPTANENSDSNPHTQTLIIWHRIDLNNVGDNSSTETLTFDRVYSWTKFEHWTNFHVISSTFALTEVPLDFIMPPSGQILDRPPL